MANNNVDTKKKGRDIGKIIARKKQLKKELKALEKEEEEKKELQELQGKLKEKQKGKTRKAIEKLSEKGKQAGKEIISAIQQSARRGNGNQDFSGVKRDKINGRDKPMPTGDPKADDFWLTDTFSRRNRSDKYWVGG